MTNTKRRHLYKSSLIKRLKQQIISLKRIIRNKQRIINYSIEKMEENGIEYDLSICNKGSHISFNFYQGQHHISQKNSKEINDLQFNIFKNILFNIGKPENHYQYSLLFYELSYAIYTTSWAAYRILRSVLPFPAESTLRTKFSPAVKNIENRLTNINEIENTLMIRQNIQNSKDFDFIVCTLAIDAFSISTLEKEKKNNTFLYLMIPLDLRLQAFPVYMECQKSGNANDNTIKNMDKIFSDSLQTKYQIKFFSRW